MKIMIASDIHGSAYYCDKLLKAYEEEKAERLLLLGDLLYHGPRNDLPKEYHPKAVIQMLNEKKKEITFKELSVETLMDILTEPKHAIIKQFKEMYSFDTNIELNFTEGALREIATRAKTKKIGARGLRSVLEEVLDEVGFEYPSIKDLKRIDIKDDLTYEYICEAEVVAKDIVDLEENNEEE